MKFDKLDGCGTFFRNPLEGDFIVSWLRKILKLLRSRPEGFRQLSVRQNPERCIPNSLRAREHCWV